MGLRLVAPMKRKDSSRGQFVQRIPSDLRERLSGMTLEVPVGGEVIPITITDKMQAMRFSLRTADRGQLKQRQAEAIAYLEGVFRNLRANSPITLTHRQCVALSGELYRSRASDMERSTRISREVDEDTGSNIRTYDDHAYHLEEGAGAEALTADRVLRFEGTDMERQLGL